MDLMSETKEAHWCASAARLLHMNQRPTKHANISHNIPRMVML